MDRKDAYLIVKRDLYYRPKSNGHTGIRDHAGRYTLDEVAQLFPNRDHANQDGIEFVHEDDAPEFTTACFHDLKADHLQKQRDEARAALSLAVSRGCNHCADSIRKAREVAGTYQLAGNTASDHGCLTVRDLLATFNRFMSGAAVTPQERETTDRLAVAAAYGSAAFLARHDDDQGTLAMIRSILIALDDPLSAELDYLCDPGVQQARGRERASRRADRTSTEEAKP